MFSSNSQNAGAGGFTGWPLKSDCTLLMNFDGANNSTSFIDASPSGLSWSVSAGSPVISTNQAKFGGSSLKLQEGYGLNCSVAESALVGSSDFYVGFFIYPTGGGDGIRAIYPFLSPAGSGYFGLNSTFKAYNLWGSSTTGSSTISQNAWTLIEFSFDKLSNTMKLYVNRTLEASTVNAGTPSGGYQRIQLSNSGTTQPFYIDGLIVSNKAFVPSGAVPSAALT